ncbi:MAG TPA: choice-of-anchor tandem repeat GloVer-containing protein [Candidatus Binatia bacterium]|nr:choice-of-anchor tandem repeat GloVer-containing protein [Candidatus Binatia bacterium]
MRIRHAIAVALFALLAGNSWASTETILYSFTGGADGSNPASQLVFDSAGNAYGTTVTGGPSDCGVVFQLTPTGQGQYQQTVLHSFNCFDDGKNPYGGVTLDSAGNLYGTTAAGGTGGVCVGDGCGVVYKLTHSGGGWTETVLYSFLDAPDAGGPGSAVVFDAAGDLLGTAPDGGAFGVGAVYQLTSSNGQWSERIIHDFTGGDDGSTGFLGRLLPDAFGNFYGVTELGGANGAGTVFKLAPASGGAWTFSTLYAFGSQPDAAFPYGGLIADRNGNLYGTSYFGGTFGAGAVFRVGPGPGIGGWRDAVLYSFQGSTDGANPTSTLVFTPTGRLLGTTSAGGDSGCDCGVIFALSPTGVNRWLETVLHTFGAPPDGEYSYYGLTPDGAGHYFGTTAAGGVHNQGSVFELTP